MRPIHLTPLVAIFIALLSRVVLAEPTSTPKSEPATGVEGVISVGPIQGGPSRQGVPDSRPLANTEFLVEAEKGPAASFTTDDQGRFRISLPPGHYTISKKGPKARIGNYSFEVDVAAGQMRIVQWHCDTGVR